MAGAGTPPASDDHLNELAISIRSTLDGLSPPSDCCIFTVPEKLRRQNEEAYTPRVVAIGPYHHLNPSLMWMKHHKLLYLQKFLQHSQNPRLEDYVQRVKSWEDEARNCYDKQIDLDSDKFTEMMLLDGIFVIQLFLTDNSYQSVLPNDRIFGKPWMFNDVCRDMVLLENQIPFFVIQRLIEMASNLRQQHMHELVGWFFKTVTGKEKLPESVMESEVKHLLHAISLSFLPSVSKASNQSNEQLKFTPSATELVAVGVKLTRGESKCLLDIKFESGVLNIPYLVLEDSTEHYFRNIIAFEQCYCGDRYLTDYIAFIDHLVDTPGDAELMIDKGIIENLLSNKEVVARVINGLGKENILFENYYFNSLSDELIKHWQRPCNKWKATFKRDYCSSLWVVISIIAAGVLLLLTITQTVFSALSLK